MFCKYMLIETSGIVAANIYSLGKKKTFLAK